MNSLSDRYQQLNERRVTVLQQIAVRKAEEKSKAEERSKLEAELKAAGVDFTKPEEEITRLRREIEDHSKGVDEELTVLEELLGIKPTSPETLPKTVDLYTTTCKPTIDDLDID